jgi:hypothetical protein
MNSNGEANEKECQEEGLGGKANHNGRCRKTSGEQQLLEVLGRWQAHV